MSGEQERLPPRWTDSNRGNGGDTGKGPGAFGGRWDTGGDPIQAHAWVPLKCEEFENRVSKLKQLQMQPRWGIFIPLSLEVCPNSHPMLLGWILSSAWIVPTGTPLSWERGVPQQLGAIRKEFRDGKPGTKDGRMQVKQLQLWKILDESTKESPSVSGGSGMLEGSLSLLHGSAKALRRSWSTSDSAVGNTKQGRAWKNNQGCTINSFCSRVVSGTSTNGWTCWKVLGELW